MLRLLGTLVVSVPVGTNLGLLHLLWMLVSGHLLTARGAVIPGLSGAGLSARAVRRAWAALGQGDWTSAQVLPPWRALVLAEGRWQPHRPRGHQPGAGDVTRLLRAPLQGRPHPPLHAPGAENPPPPPRA